MERRRGRPHRGLGTLGGLVLLVLGCTPGIAAAARPARPAAMPAKTCGGETPGAKPGGGAWTCTFDDEFSAATADATTLNRSWWTPQVTATSGFATGPSGAEACYVDSSRNISVSAGALHLTARREAAPFNCGSLRTQYTSGMVSTYTGFNQAYGRFEVRALLPPTTVAGLQETFWLWPVNDLRYGPHWPDSGEIDFSEFYSDYSWLDVPYLHYNYDPASVNAATSTNTVTATNCQIAISSYHAYAVVWAPGTFTITVDGRPCLVDHYIANGGLTGAQPFDQPFFIALTQALGVAPNAFNPATTPLPATTSIDYVRVWK
jgi:beta-glucanase (GH16 family)